MNLPVWDIDLAKVQETLKTMDLDREILAISTSVILFSFLIISIRPYFYFKAKKSQTEAGVTSDHPTKN